MASDDNQIEYNIRFTEVTSADNFDKKKIKEWIQETLDEYFRYEIEKWHPEEVKERTNFNVKTPPNFARGMESWVERIVQLKMEELIKKDGGFAPGVNFHSREEWKKTAGEIKDRVSERFEDSAKWQDRFRKDALRGVRARIAIAKSREERYPYDSGGLAPDDLFYYGHEYQTQTDKVLGKRAMDPGLHENEVAEAARLINFQTDPTMRPGSPMNKASFPKAKRKYFIKMQKLKQKANKKVVEDLLRRRGEFFAGDALDDAIEEFFGDLDFKMRGAMGADVIEHHKYKPIDWDYFGEAPFDISRPSFGRNRKNVMDPSRRGMWGVLRATQVPDSRRIVSGISKEADVPMGGTAPSDINHKNFKNRFKPVTPALVHEIINERMGNIVQGNQLLHQPMETMGNMFLQLLNRGGPKGKAIAAAIGAIVVTPELIQSIVRLLGQKGHPLNRDWERFIEDEANGLFSVESKKRRLLGLDGYVVTQTTGYEPESGSDTRNSLENRDEIIITKLGLAERSVGIDY